MVMLRRQSQEHNDPIENGSAGNGGEFCVSHDPMGKGQNCSMKISDFGLKVNREVGPMVYPARSQVIEDNTIHSGTLTFNPSFVIF
jgi:hypothetical protein